MSTTATVDKSTALDERRAVRAMKRSNGTGAVLLRLIDYMAGGAARSVFAVATIVRACAIIALVLIPYFTGRAINVVSDPSGTVADLRNWTLLACAAGGVYVVTSFFAERMFAELATKALSRLQSHLFAHMQTLSLNFFDRQPIGELLSRVSNDTEVIALFYEQGVGPIIRAIMQIVIITVIMVIVDWHLTVVAMLIVPVMLIATSVVERVSSPAFSKLQEELGTLSGFQEETLSGHKVLISKRRQTWASEAHEQQAVEVYRVGQRAFFTSLLQYPLTQAMSTFQVVLVLVAGAFMVIDGTTTLGLVIAFSGYAALLARPLSDIANLTSTALNAVAGGERVFGIIDEEPQIKDAPDAADYEFKGGHVEFKDVDFSYVPGRKILRHNTFEAAPGESIGICGPTGAGKSTLINILTRYYDVDRGTILIDGQNLTELSQGSLRKQIGVVLQEAFLFTDTVMNNLKYAREGATDEECIEAAKQANAHEFIMNLPQGYDTMLTERGANLSQGQRQMVTIARAMVAQPKLLVLDEATSNVDTRTERLIQQGLRRLMGDKTSFSIAHRLATIRDSAAIMVLNAGEIVEMGPHDELMAMKGFYYTLYMSQFKGKAPAGGDAGAAEFVST
jgi:ABC-type multidrug transport system fused ATPase/permease subunit